MKPVRILAALLAAPLVGSLLYLVAIIMPFPSSSISGDDLKSTFVFMAVVAVLFEVCVLLPIAVFLQRRERFTLLLMGIGVVAWLVLVASGLALSGSNALTVAISSAQLLVLGVPVVLTFAAIVRVRNPV